MTRPVIIMGAGGHARVLAEALRVGGRTVVGCVAPKAPARPIPDVAYLGDDTVLARYSSGDVDLVNGIGSVGNPARRIHVYEQGAMIGYRFAAVVHPSAILASDVTVSDGVQLMAGVIVQPGCKIGRNTIINTGVCVDHDCVIGADVHLAPGAVLSGGVIIGDRTHVGTGASVIQSIAIGADVVVGAGAIVISDVPDGAVAVGVPARCIRNKST